MDETIAGLFGAVAALGAVSATHATPLAPLQEILHANSYADLLEPIPNAGAVLKAMDREESGISGAATLQQVQYHHHHHHY